MYYALQAKKKEKPTGKSMLTDNCCRVKCRRNKGEKTFQETFLSVKDE